MSGRNGHTVSIRKIEVIVSYQHTKKGLDPEQTHSGSRLFCFCRGSAASLFPNCRMVDDTEKCNPVEKIRKGRLSLLQNRLSNNPIPSMRLMVCSPRITAGLNFIQTRSLNHLEDLWKVESPMQKLRPVPTGPCWGWRNIFISADWRNL